MSENQTAEQQEQQALAEFESGFSGTRDDAPVEEPKKTETAESKPEGSTEETPNDETPQASPIAGMTEDQIRALLAKASEVDALKSDFDKKVRDLYGRFGEINSHVQSLQKAPGGARFSRESLKRISEINEELADALAADLSGALPAQDINWDEQLNPRIDKLRQEITLDVERRALLRQHKDFYEQIGTPEFTLWLGQQSAEDQKEFNSSIDSDYLSGKMSAFKTWRASLDKKQDKQRRLEQAVKPQGTQVAEGAKTAEQEFEEGFRSVRARWSSPR